MNNIQKRFLLFLIGCMGVRSILVYFAKEHPEYLTVMGFFSLIIGAGFIYINLTNSRKTGAEVFGDKIWWNNLRPIHGSLYLLFGILAINKYNFAWIVLLIDLLVGLVGFLHYHYTAGNFAQLIQ